MTVVLSLDISKAYKDVDRTCQGLQHFRDKVSDRWFNMHLKIKVHEAAGDCVPLLYLVVVVDKGTVPCKCFITD